MRIPHGEYLALHLEAHELLKEVPLRDVSAVDLAGGGDGRTIADVLRLMEMSRERPSTAVWILVAVRRFIGKVFYWDGDKPEPSYAHRLSADQRLRSLTPIGAASGPLRVLYEFPLEMVGEVENATVHAFACMALSRRAAGYRLYWAIYVRNVSRFTPIYMAAIEPFRRWVVYPSILGRISAGWRKL